MNNVSGNDQNGNPAPTTYYVNHQYARAWACLGILTFPCHQDKTPCTPNGFKDATTDLDQIDRWWAEWPDAIPALHLGPAGIFVADLDCHRGAPNGVLHFKALAPRYGQTFSNFFPTSTAGGGLHLWFDQSDIIQPLGSGRGLFRGMGIDFRGQNSYVIAPGAVLADGRRWGTDEEIRQLFDHLRRRTLPRVPQWMRDWGAGQTWPEDKNVGQTFDGPLTVRMLENAQSIFNGEVKELELRGPQTNRGNQCFALGCRIGRIITEGYLDLEECVGKLAAAMPDNWNAYDHSFRRGVQMSKGLHQLALKYRADAWEDNWAKMKASGLKLKNPPKLKDHMPKYTPTRNDMPEFKPRKPRRNGGDGDPMPVFRPAAGAPETPEMPEFHPGADMPDFIAEATDVPLQIRLNLRSAACIFMVDVRARRKAEAKQQQYAQALMFLRSLLGAGFATSEQLAAQWDTTTKDRFSCNALAQSEAATVRGQLATLTPDDPGLARYAADCMIADPRFDAIKAIRKVFAVAELEYGSYNGVAVQLVKAEDVGERFARFDAPGHAPTWVDRHTGRFFTKDEMDIATAGQVIECVENGEVSYKPAGLCFRMWTGMQVYREMVFTNQPTAPDQLNLFHGLGASPRPGDCDLILQHVHEVICGGDNKAAEAFFDLEAWQLQNIGTPSRIVRVLVSGKQQPGKTLYAESVMLAIYGAAGVAVSNKEPLKGRFNTIYRAKAFALHDEVLFSGDHESNNSLKRLSASTKLYLEPKGKEAAEAPVAVNIMVTTNHDNAVSIEEGDARIWALKVSEHRIGDHAYFRALADQIEHGGREAYLAFLLERDVSQFIPQRDIPMDNELKRHMMMLSVKHGTVQHWLLDVVVKGSFAAAGGAHLGYMTPADVNNVSASTLNGANSFVPPQAGNVLDFGKRCSTSLLYEAYVRWHDALKGRFIEDPVMIAAFKLTRYGFENVGQHRINGSQPKSCVRIPTLAQLAEILHVEPLQESNLTTYSVVNDPLRPLHND